MLDLDLICFRQRYHYLVFLCRHHLNIQAFFNRLFRQIFHLCIQIVGDANAIICRQNIHIIRISPYGDIGKPVSEKLFTVVIFASNCAVLELFLVNLIGMHASIEL